VQAAANGLKRKPVMSATIEQSSTTINGESTSSGELPLKLELELIIDDRDVIQALVDFPEGDERNQYAAEALKIGVVAMRHVGGMVTADQFRRDGDRFLAGLERTLEQHKQTVQSQIEAKLKEYFDPKDGRFSDRVQRLVSQDGELSVLIKGFIDGENSQLARTMFAQIAPLMKHLDPEQSEGLLAVFRNTFESQLNQHRDHVLKEFSLDHKDGALCRLVTELTNKHGDLSKDLQKKIDEVIKEFSLNEEGSALKRLVDSVDRAQRRICDEFSLDNEESALKRFKTELMTVFQAHVDVSAKFQEEVKVALRELTARREEQARSTLHGGTFQLAVFEFLHQQSEQRGDVAEFKGDQVGAVKGRKWGDVVVELGVDTAAPGARVVFEAKEEQDYTLKKALTEIENARKNRLAEIGVFVYSKKTAPIGLRSLTRFGNDIVTVWDAEDASNDAFLIAALELARAMCIHSRRQRDSQVGDFDSIEAAMTAIEKHAKNLDEIRTSAVTIQNANENILKRVRIDREALESQVIILRKKIGDLRAITASVQ
jgi:hypothetical protein